MITSTKPDRRRLHAFLVAGMVLCVTVAATAIGAIQYNRSFPYFQCQDGSRMYVDHPRQEWWVDFGPRHKSSEVDAAYEVAWNRCAPDIKP